MSRRLAPLALLGALFAIVSPVEAGYDLFVSQITSNTTGQVVRIDAAGNPTVFAEAGLNRPTGLAFDSSGNLYVSNTGDNTIRSFGPDGASRGVFASTNLSEPYGLAFDPSGTLYVGNDNNTISRFDAAGNYLGNFNGGATPAQLVFDASGNLNVVDLNGGEVHRFSPTGQDLGTFITGLNVPYGLAIDAAGNYFVSELFTNQIREFSSTGQDLGVFANLGLSNPSGLAFDADGNLYVVNNNNGAGGFVREFSPTGADLGIVASGLSGATFLTIRPSAVPEPGGLALVASGLLIVGLIRNRTARGAA